MKISTSLNIFWEVGVEIQDALERCAKAGFEALDFNLTDYQRMESPPFLNSKGEEWAAHISRTAESFGLAFTQMHAPIFPKFAVRKETERLYYNEPRLSPNRRCYENPLGGLGTGCHVRGPWRKTSQRGVPEESRIL